jgi:hypothetical protein
MKIGIRSFKNLKDGKVLIEVDTDDDFEKLNSQIQDKCGNRLETKVQKRRKPRLIIYNIPEEVTLENAVDVIYTQNSALKLNKGDITTKFIFQTKKKERKKLGNRIGPTNPQTNAANQTKN